MAAEEQSDQMASDMEVCMKQRCVIEFLHEEKKAPVDIYRPLLDVYEGQTVDVSSVRWWMVCFSSGNSNNGYLCWCRLLVVQHAGCCLSLVKMRNYVTI